MEKESLKCFPLFFVEATEQRQSEEEDKLDHFHWNRFVSALN